MSEGLDDTFLPPKPSAAPEDGAAPGACPKCGKALDPNVNFCAACGADLRGTRAGESSLSGPLRDAPIDGRYRILEKLGEGGMGAVYKVEHVRMGKIAALKLMRPDFASDRALTQRFLQEARVVARLSHPNTVQVFDTGSLEDGSLYIAMEYVPGKDLAWQLRASGPISEAKAIGIGLQVLASLQEAHEAGIVHRDIKPANVMVVRRRKSGDDQVKLLDFGIAKLQEAEGRRSTTGEFVGTPAYMSPEQIRAENVDARSDLYSLGALLFELVTGRQLYVGPTPMSVVTQHTEGNLPRIVDVRPDTAVSPGFEAILRKALAREPRDRFSDAEAMRAALKGLRQDRRSTTHDLTPIPAELADKMLSRQDFDRYERRLRLGRVLAPMLTLVAIITLGASLWRYGIATPPNTPLLTREVEPNDHPSQATPIALSTSVEGAIGASPTNDRDLYVFTVAQAGPVRITLSGVPDLNLTLEVLQFDRTPEGERLRRRLFLDDVGVGAGERVEALHLGVGKAYLRVEEKPFCTEPNRPPREKSLVPYVLRVEAMPGGAAIEFEPNDSDSTAQALPLTQAVVAFCGERIDDLEKRTQMRLDSPFSSPDWFRVDAAPGETVLVAVVPPERGALFFLDGAALETWRAKKASSTPRNPAPPPPVPQLVRNAPVLFELKTTSAGTGRFRVTTDGEALPGTAYHLAAATTGENGLTGWLDLARLLHDADRGAARSAFLSQAVGRVGSSPDLPRLKALLAAP